jgi:3-deoxy-7-phosphoheptulonate synthase
MNQNSVLRIHVRRLAAERGFSPTLRTAKHQRFSLEGNATLTHKMTLTLLPALPPVKLYGFEATAMLVVMQAQATPEQVRAVCEKVESLGYRAHPIPGAQRTAIGITGNQGVVELSLDDMPGVQELIRVSKPYKLVSRDIKQENTVIRFPGTGIAIGGRELAVVAGPCAVESREQAFAVAERVSRQGVHFFRGGAYKPRTSPYSFQGLGEEGLRILADIRERFGMLIVTEAIDNDSIDLVEEYADVIQIGARNMQNFSLLKRAGRSRKPVLLKRGMSATLEEFLMAAEYIMSEGNYNIVLCERGVRTFADHTRNTLDLSLIPAVQRLSHLPILVDPSHGTGKRNKVKPLSRAAVAVGADGLIVEVHNDPDRALSDGMQSLYPDQFDELMAEVRPIAAVVRREVAAPLGAAASAD